MRRAGASAALMLALLALAEARSAAYDQRQTGEVNVQIDVKDLRIVALLDSDVLSDYANYDYAYDYADFTIKPRPTTGRPSSTASTPAGSSTETPSTTAASEQPSSTSTQAPASSVITAGSSPMIIIPEGTNSTDAGKIIEGVSSANKAELEKQKEQQQQQLEATTVSSSTASGAKLDENENKRPAEPRKRCPVGFLLKSGRCFKRRLSLISPRLAIMKLAPKLLSKSKVLSAKLAAGNS